jgi:hypothetical protein
MSDDFDKRALAEAEARWPTYFSGMIGEREKERYDTFVAGARWAKEQAEADTEPLLARAETLKKLTGMSLHQIAVAVGLASRQQLYDSNAEPQLVTRFAQLEKLVESLDGPTSKERGEALFSTENGKSLYQLFKASSAKLHRN